MELRLTRAPIPRALPALIQRHERTLWWLHSIWALLFGIGVMWLGTQKYTYLRLAFFHILFIWMTSIGIGRLASLSFLNEAWHGRIRLVVNYFNKNFYQQLLFFIIPMYFASASFTSINIVFVALLAVSAVLSTFDLFYDRHLSVRRAWTAGFFAFNVFACINLALPVLWSISNVIAMRIAAALALVGFLTLVFRRRDLRRLRSWGVLVAVAGGLFVVSEVVRMAIPPAPLRVVSAQFARSVRRADFQVIEPLRSLAPARAMRVHAVTAVRAPLGLRERVRHRWYLDGEPIYTSPFYRLTGGREEGFRIWTSSPVPAAPRDASLHVDVETEGGQLIGRARLPVGG